MGKLEKQINKADKKMQELNNYLEWFNGPLQPRGEGARQEASKEFHNFMNGLHQTFYNLEEAQLNNLDWSIETIKLID